MAKKVLVVDDEKLIVKGIRFSLEQDGMEVDCAYDGEEALSMAKEKEYDMILLDLMLPKLDGLSVCQQIREFSNVPIVMLTAKGEDMDNKDGWFVNPVLTATGIPTIRKMSEDEYRTSRNIPISGLKQRMAQFHKRKDTPVSRPTCLTSKKIIS